VGTLVDPPVAVDGAGYGVVSANTMAALGHRPRTPAGSFGVASFATDSGSPTSVRVDVGPGGYGVIGWVKDNASVELRRSQAGLATWTQTTAPLVGSPYLILGQDVAASATGQVMQVWSEEWPTVSFTQRHVIAQLFGTNNQPVGSAVELLPGGTMGATQVDPQVDFDATGNAIALFRDHMGVYASRYVPASGWGSAVTLSVIGTIQFSDPRLAVAADGKALAAWLQTDLLALGPGKELWTARYTPASGWAPTRRVSTPGIGVTSFDVGIDAAGGSLVVWKQADHAGLLTASP
jgi:hypothetical protein